MFEKLIPNLKVIFIPCLQNRYRPRFLEGRFLSYYFLFLLLLKLISVFYIVYLPKSIFFADLSAATLMKLTNQGRQSLGLNPLKVNSQLSEAAFLKAQDIMQKDYFSHESPDGKTPWYWIKQADYDYRYAGENLAIGFLEAEETYQAWMDSPSHKANLFSPKYQDTGVAVLKGDFNGKIIFVVVQLFGLPRLSTGLEEQPIETKEEAIQKEQPIETEPTETEPIGKESIPEEKDLKEPLPPIYLSALEEQEIEKDFSFHLFQFLSTIDYDNIVQYLIFYSLLFILGILILNIIIKFDIQHRDLIAKGVFFIALFSLLILLNKDLVIRFIPHNLIIY